jgi:hypothetical protein
MIGPDPARRRTLPVIGRAISLRVGVASYFDFVGSLLRTRATLRWCSASVSANVEEITVVGIDLTKRPRRLRPGS